MENPNIFSNVCLRKSKIEFYRENEIAVMQEKLDEALADPELYYQISEWEKWILQLEKATPEELMQDLFEKAYESYESEKRGWM